jgi:hypothetical protein
MRFGIYFYPWFGVKKWREQTKLCMPVIGEYKSDDEVVIRWQLAEIERSSIDYIIFELPPISDWCFSICDRAISKAIHLISEENLRIKFTFLLDATFSVGQSNFIYEVLQLIDHINARGWFDGIIQSAENKKLLYIFAPYPWNAQNLKQKLYSQYTIYYPATFPHWNFEVLSFNEPSLKAYTTDAFKAGKTLESYLGDLDFCQFWSPTEKLRVINKIAAVVPGYNDLHLGREAKFMPIVERDDGHTYVSQMHCAIQSNPDEVLIYGWNEYFEATTIEPTIEYGDFYVELTRRLISQAKRGVKIHFPGDMGKPNPAEPIYLTPALEQAAQRHPDKVPRWDQDYYVAQIKNLSSVEINANFALFRNITVSNVGLKSWNISKGPDPIRLGAKLCDNQGNVLCEARAELSSNDIAMGEQVTVDLQIEIAGLPPGHYNAVIDVVWEDEFWFGSSCSRKIELNAQVR